MLSGLIATRSNPLQLVVLWQDAWSGTAMNSDYGNEAPLRVASSVRILNVSSVPGPSKSFEKLQNQCYNRVMKKVSFNLLFFYFIIFLFFVLDRVLKYSFASKKFPESFWGVFSLHQNKGIAFGIGVYSVILWVLIIAIIIGLAYWSIKYFIKQKFNLHLSLVLVFFGALSNVIDRLTYGYVIDYFDLKVWPVFNLADCMVVVGVVLFTLRLKRRARDN